MYDLVPGDLISGCIAFNGFYDLDLTHRLANHAQDGGLLVDVGANMGYFSLLWAGLGRSAEAISIEPAPRNVALLRNNILRNRLESRVVVIEKAAGESSGPASFDVGPEDQTGWGGLRQDECPRALTVPLTRLDVELEGRNIAVLKIDVEGADTLVLRGCRGLLRERRIRRIYFEENPERMSRLGIRSGDGAAFLGEVGYKCRPLKKGRVTDWIAEPA
jgi:FkbM family methyltransferase